MNPQQTMFQEARRYLAVVKRRKALLLASFGVAMIAATIYNYSARPLYRATVQLLFEPAMPDPLGGRGRALGRRSDKEYLATQYQILGGKALAEQVIGELKLTQSDELRTGPLMSPWERFQRRFLGGKPDTDERGMAITPAVSAFRSRVGIEPVPQSNIARVSFTAYDPELAARAANALAETYIAHGVELQDANSSEATGWLSARLADQRARVERARRALGEYEQREGIVNVEERRRLLEQKLGSLHSALMNARTQRMAKETVYNELLATPRDQLATFPVVRSSPVIQGLKAELEKLESERRRLSEVLGDKHPDMIALVDQIAQTQRRIAEETDQLVESLANDYNLALQEEQTFEASLEPVQQELQTLKGATIEYDILQREVQANEQLLRNLMNRTNESGLEGQLDNRNVQILERADPPRAPFHPNKSRNYRLAAIVGLALGLSLILLVEQMDQTLKTPDDVKDLLAIPFLGMVPDALGPHRPNAPLGGPLILRNPRSAMAEAYRVIRTNLIFSTAGGSGRALVVSSSNPGDGKSTTSINLAASLAQNGARVLLVDADLRRPTLHEHLGVPSEPGLSDLIVGNAELSQAIHSTSFKGLDALPSGYLPPNPTELLGARRLPEVFAELRQTYDWVLIDSPPILAMADTPILTPLADGLILVVAAGTTQRTAAARSIEQILSVGGKPFGVVMNRVDVDSATEYYGRGYGEYYSVRPASEAVPRKGGRRLSPPGA